MSPRTEPYQCEDCTGIVIPYMVKDSVWLRAWPTYEEDRQSRIQFHKGKDPPWKAWCILCLSCLQARLGRLLVIQDFPAHLPVNEPIYFGYGIAIREQRKARGLDT